MRRNILFKALVDILFVFQLIGIIGLFFVMPFGVTRINIMDLPVSKWTWFFWLILLISVIGYVIFVIGLYHLRKVARHLLTNKYFDIPVVIHLKKCGQYFISCGIFGFVIFLAMWILNITTGRLSLYDSNVMLTLFIITIGLFFVIQSEVILSAKSFKEDSDLTI